MLQCLGGFKWFLAVSCGFEGVLTVVVSPSATAPATIDNILNIDRPSNYCNNIFNISVSPYRETAKKPPETARLAVFLIFRGRLGRVVWASYEA